MLAWSPQQEAIFEWFSKQRKPGEKKNLVVVARAGTGKTTTIMEGVDRAWDERVLLCAFNKSIAVELQGRLRNPRAEAKTLHSVGFGFVLRNWSGVQLDDERPRRLAIKVLGSAPDPMLALVCKLSAFAKGACPFPTEEQMVNLAYQIDCDPDEEWEQDGWTVQRIAQAAMRVMDLSATERDGTIDFDDMVFVPVRNKWVRGRFDLVVVDEGQDMNPAQLIMAQGLVKPGGRMGVVGDDRQAIYGFRGADITALQNMTKKLDAQVLGLTITRRCPKKVVAYAKNLVPDFESAPEAPEGEITEVNFDKLHERAKPGDFILSRKNAPLAKACLRLLRHNIRATVKGKDVGRGLLSVIKAVRGTTVVEFMERLSKWEKRVTDRLAATKKKGADIKIEHIRDQAETLRALAEGLANLSELKRRVDDLFSEDNEKANGRVVCSSIHKSKGLESDQVFVMVETLYPGGRKSEIEECNLDYVAATRSKRSLVWLKGIS